jgi:hypothetical protein
MHRYSRVDFEDVDVKKEKEERIVAAASSQANKGPLSRDVHKLCLFSRLLLLCRYRTDEMDGRDFPRQTNCLLEMNE